MNYSKKILAAFLIAVFSCAAVISEENTEPAEKVSTAEKQTTQKLSFVGDMFNTNIVNGISFEYSANKYFDFGFGALSPAFLILPCLEAHTYIRVCFLDYFIQPYVQLGVSISAPGQIGHIDENGNTVMCDEWFTARIGVGAKFTFGEHFYLGVGGGYCFAGKELIATSDWYGMNWQGFYPAIFLGYTFLNF